MTSMLFYVILVALWSIIPALIVCVVLFLRGVAAERRIEGLEMRKLDVDGILSSIAKAKEEIAAVDVKVMSVEESLSHFNNKWNARIRTETAAEERRAKKEKEKNNGSGELDGEQLQQMQMFPAMPQTPQTQPRRRAFGEFPS